jgi:membrane protein implicated in regulation of membrane protease activity
VLLIVALVCFLVLPSPWDAVAFAAFLLLGAIEVFYWWRKVRHRRVEAGAETLIDSPATVVLGCHPDGQVRVQGALWNARCADGADPGDTVRVVRRDDLLLIVESDRSAG